MSEYVMRNTGDAIEVVQLRPVVIGRFETEEYAMVFLSSLNGSSAPTVQARPAKPAPKVAETAPAKPQAPKPPKTEASEAEVANDTPWTDDELDEALLRLLNGEKIRDVARDFGKSWTALRSKWASSKSELMAVKSPDTPDSTAECKMCGRTFKQNRDNLDLCARCNNDV